MMDILKFSSILIVAAILSLILKEYKSNIRVLIGITGCVISGVFILSKFTPIFGYLNDIKHFNNETFVIILKALGIAYLTEFASALCRDCEEKTLSQSVEVIGKAEILVISFPLFKQLMDLCTEMVS